ncbi:MAG: hypothetical protein ICV85_05785, partial [Tolypothrix sp. T3-bin4]|nr:hypothetical protein [Tolypothrix sp. T3-bin4]
PDPAFAAELETRLLGANVVDASSVFLSQKTEELPETQQNRSRFSPSLNVLIQGTRTIKLAVLRSRPIHRFSIAAMALLAISSVVVVSTPSLRSLAQAIFENFSHTSSDQVGTTETRTGKRPPLTEEQKRTMREVKMVERKMQMEQRTTTTVREMEIERGFDLKEPTFIPTGYVFDKKVGSPFPHVVGFGYKNSQNNAKIVISQKRLDGEKVIGPTLEMPLAKYKSKGITMSIGWFPPQPKTLFGSKDPALQQVDKSPVGASAKIESVQIGNLTGEYVEGAWESIVDQDAISGMRWNQNAPLRQIQWKSGNVLFQIATTNQLSRDELVAIARSMK